MRICIYCSSSNKIDRAYFEATEKLASIFLDSNIEIVLGGGSSGLMGCLADAYCAKDGRIQGVMPRFMRDVEWAHKGIKDFIFTEDMRERKELMIENVDAVVCLPGGTGTLEELLETITLKRLGKFLKPIVILNTQGFYNDLQVFFTKMIEQNFFSKEHENVWTFVDTPEEILSAIRNAESWSADCIHNAVVR